MFGDAYLIETGLLVLVSVTIGTATIALTAIAAALVIALMPEDTE
jgi:predicted benzoate:H+ symporter BenE